MEYDMLDLGGITVTWLNGGEFKLDGGAMFGVVPKLLWSRKYPADADNLIAMRAAPLLLRSAGATIMIDTGLGNKLTDKQRQIYRVARPWQVAADLSRMGLTPEDITAVVLTHCDFDHAGGIVRYNAAGASELTFANARHIIHTREWAGVRHPNSRSSHSYFSHNFTGLADSGRLELIDADLEVAPGIILRYTGGHTDGHQLVEMNGRRRRAVHFGDLMPTHAHANPLWTMAYDDYPLQVIALKEKLIPHYRDAGYLFTFYHDMEIAAGQIDAEMEFTPWRF